MAALLSSNLENILLIVRWRKVISGVEVLVLGILGAAFPLESRVELAANGLTNISAFSFCGDNCSPSSSVKGGNEAVLKFRPTTSGLINRVVHFEYLSRGVISIHALTLLKVSVR